MRREAIGRERVQQDRSLFLGLLLSLRNAPLSVTPLRVPP